MHLALGDGEFASFKVNDLEGARCPGSRSSSGEVGRRARRRVSSIARRRAVVNSQARQSDWSPRKPGSPRTTCSQVSAATSSAASGAITRRYRSKAGLASRHSRVRAASLPDWATVSTAANSSPTTEPSIGTLAPSRSRSSALVSNGMRLLAAGRQTGSRWRRSAVVPVTFTVTASTPVAGGALA
jgi:hypothetical protein